ncbi:hypothetical protein KC316_g18 [Hortaea werneckii]|nr:hypothetical protein KC316_g18 [Hortaea werneckii]
MVVKGAQRCRKAREWEEGRKVRPVLLYQPETLLLVESARGDRRGKRVGSRGSEQGTRARTHARSRKQSQERSTRMDARELQREEQTARDAVQEASDRKEQLQLQGVGVGWRKVEVYCAGGLTTASKTAKACDSGCAGDDEPTRSIAWPVLCSCLFSLSLAPRLFQVRRCTIAVRRRPAQPYTKIALRAPPSSVHHRYANPLSFQRTGNAFDTRPPLGRKNQPCSQVRARFANDTVGDQQWLHELYQRSTQHLLKVTPGLGSRGHFASSVVFINRFQPAGDWSHGPPRGNASFHFVYCCKQEFSLHYDGTGAILTICGTPSAWGCIISNAANRCCDNRCKQSFVSGKCEVGITADVARSLLFKMLTPRQLMRRPSPTGSRDSALLGD